LIGLQQKKYKEIEAEAPQIAVSNRPLENFYDFLVACNLKQEFIVGGRIVCFLQSNLPMTKVRLDG
jgi:hypothetical protein